ncbi:virB8 family protein [Novosphingopyxis sp.]|uniref:virB8 family protein n=1 Tax=Novosphingopyxis sp. TaxID=2709690 RepID=UPI003B59E140
MREGPIEAEDDLDEYFRDAGSWAEDRAAGIRRSRRLAWWIAGGAGFIAVLEAIALVALTPLKAVEPYTLLVDKQTGYVEALTPVDGNLVTPDAALTRSFLAQYVIARESFAIDTVQQDYRKVALWSADGARSGYIADMQAGNPNSPLTRYPRRTVIDTEVKSVSSLGDNVSLVRFDTLRTAPNGGGEVRQPYAAVVRWRYSGEPMSVEDRMLNPLGFQVTRYRKDAEALPAVQEARPATPLERLEGDERIVGDGAAPPPP